MKVCMINPFFYPYVGGTENYLYELSRRLVSDYGCKVSVVTSRLDGTKKEEVIDGIRVKRLPSMVFKNLPSLLPPPYAIPLSFPLREYRRADILHLHNRFFLGYNAVAFLKMLLGKPLFLSLHNSRTSGIDAPTDFLGGIFDGTLGNMVIRSADRIIANSQNTLDTTAPFAKQKARVIYNGIDAEKYRRLPVEKGGGFTIISVARLQPQKGFEYLIRAMPLLPECRAVIVGGGPDMQRLERIAENEGVAGRVEFTGKISNEELFKRYSSADAFVLPSTWEPFGIAILEAMCFELPVIASNAGGIPEVVGDAGLLFQSRNPADLASKVRMLLVDRALGNKLGKQGRERAEKVFNWDTITGQVHGFYSDYLEGNPKNMV